MASMGSVLRSSPFLKPSSAFPSVSLLQHHAHFSLPPSPARTRCTIASPSTPSPSPPPSSNLMPGCAENVGTTRYAQRIGAGAGPGHFRSFKVGLDVGDLVASSIGLGTYLGDDTDDQDRDYIESMIRGFQLGVNLIDTASNYRNMRSEVAIGKAVSQAIKQGIINRNEVIICSKAGFLAYDYRNLIEARKYIEIFVKNGLFPREELMGNCHCLTPAFIRNQVEISRQNFGMETIDVYFVHNPETQTMHIPRAAVMGRIKAAFEVLEECARQGKITMYGVATWTGFRAGPHLKNHLSLEEFVNFAREVGGENHHFRVGQLPYNMNVPDAANSPSQPVNGRRLPMLHAAHQLGISVITSTTLNHAVLCNGLPPERQDFPELGERRTDAQCAIQFARSTPGVMTVLAGMGQVHHVEENCAIIKRPATRSRPAAQPAAATAAASASSASAAS